MSQLPDRPVFVMGCPRSGTTILTELLGAHASLAWVSQFCNRLPHTLCLSALNRIYDVPVLGRPMFNIRSRTRLLPHTVEPWRFFQAYLSNFRWPRESSTPPRRQTPADITPSESDAIRRAVASICKWQRRSRFLSKYTDFPRMQYILKPFPDAKFVHILRNGRSVAFSYHHLVETAGFGLWEERDWWLLGLPEELRTACLNESPFSLALAATMWKFFVGEIQSEAQLIPADRYFEIRYEDLMRSPKERIQEIIEFCELPYSRQLDDYVHMKRLSSRNYKASRQTNDSQKELLDRLVGNGEPLTSTRRADGFAFSSRHPVFFAQLKVEQPALHRPHNWRSLCTIASIHLG